MPTIARAVVPGELLDELRKLCDRLPAPTPIARAALLIAMAELIEATARADKKSSDKLN